MKLSQLLVVVTALLFVAGCGDSGPRAHVEKVVPVSGVLTFKGKPLKDFMVSLIPPDEKRVATGVTDADGKFVMGTNKTGDGAPTGLCKVSVVWVGPNAGNDAGQGDIIDDPAKMPKPDVKIPAKYNSPDSSGLKQDIPDGGLSDWKLDLTDK